MIAPQYSSEATTELFKSFIDGAITEQHFRARLGEMGVPQFGIDEMINNALKVRGSVKYGPSAQVGSSSGFGSFLHGVGSILFAIGALGGLAAYFNFFDLGFSWYTYVGSAVAGAVLGGIGGGLGGGSNDEFHIVHVDRLISGGRFLGSAVFPKKCAVCGAAPEHSEGISVSAAGVSSTFNVPHCSMHKDGVWSGALTLNFRSQDYWREFCRANNIPEAMAGEET